MRRSLLTVSLAFAAAIFVAHYILPYGFLPYAALICLFTGGMAFLPPVKRLLATSFPYIICVAFFLAAGFMWSLTWDRLFLSSLEEYDNMVEWYETEIQDYPAGTNYGYAYTVKITEPELGNMNGILYLGFDEGDFEPGDRVSCYALLKAPEPGGPWDSFAARRGRGIFFSLTPRTTIQTEKSENLSALLQPAMWAGSLSKVIDDNLPYGEAALLKGMMLGDRGDLDDGTLTGLSESGLVHILSVSGMHVVFITGFFITLFGNKRKTAIIAIPAMLLFAAITGFSPSVTRAVIMQSAILLGPVFKRESDSLTSLAFALAVILTANPHAAGSAGLQLSFAASLGIICLSSEISDALFARVKIKNKWLGRIWSFFVKTTASTCGVMALTLPLTAWYFRSVNPLSLISNLIALWAVNIVFLTGMFIALAGLLIPAAGGLLFFTGPLLGLISGVSEFISKIPYASVKLDDLYKILWFIYTYIVIAFYTAGHFYNKWKSPHPEEKRPTAVSALMPVFSCALVLCASLLLSAVDHDRNEAVFTVLDVGQGQCVVFESGRSTVIVDCGGNSAKSAGVVASDYLKGRGKTYIDLLVFTHLHGDHVNGAVDLLRLVDVGSIIFFDADSNDSVYREEIIFAAQAAGVACLTVKTDISIGLDGGYISLFVPENGGKGNEICMSALVGHGDFSALITGDTGGVDELDLMLGRQLPDVDVYIAGHHGSESSSGTTLLNMIMPETVIISVGKNNYGHPAEKTLERIAAVQAEVYRTDLDGTVTVKIGR